MRTRARRLPPATSPTQRRSAPIRRRRRRLSRRWWRRSWLSELQRGKADEREDHRNDPEANDDGGFLPAELLEVMVDRRHLEDALAGKLERRHLDDHRDGFEHEEATNDGQNDLMLGGNGDRAKSAAQ